MPEAGTATEEVCLGKFGLPDFSTYTCRMTTVAAIYARISQDRRKGTDDEGLTVDAQITACRRWIETQGWQVGKVYRDDSISATTGETRPGFEALLADRPERVVYRHQDRLARTLEDTIRVMASGISGYGIDGSRMDGTSASSEMVTIIMSAVAQSEGRTKAERIEAAHLRDAEQGKYRGSIRPFGQERDGTWVKDEAEAIREAIPGLLDGSKTFYQVAADWNARGLLPPGSGKKGGKPWTGGKVSIFFKNPRLRGIQRYRGEEFPLNGWKPLLSNDEWDQMQSLIESRKVGTHTRKRYDLNLLTNIISCGVCKKGLTSSSRNGHRIYRCPEGTGHVSVKADLVESIVKDMALRLLSRRAEADEDGAGETLAQLRHERRKVQADGDAWRAEAGAAMMPIDVIQASMDATAAKIAEIDGRIQEMEEAAGLDIFGDGGRRWDDAPIPQRREMLESVFSSLVVPKLGRGHRMTLDDLEYTFTPLGSQYMDRYQEDETLTAAELMGRTAGPNVVRQSTSSNFNPDDPWEGAEAVNPGSL